MEKNIRKFQSFLQNPRWFSLVWHISPAHKTTWYVIHTSVRCDINSQRYDASDISSFFSSGRTNTLAPTSCILETTLQCRVTGSRCSRVNAFAGQMGVCHFVLDLHKNATPPQCIVHRESHVVKFLGEIKTCHWTGWQTTIHTLRVQRWGYFNVPLSLDFNDNFFSKSALIQKPTLVNTI